MWCLYAPIICIVFGWCAYFEHLRYETTKKYFPGLTYWEYFILQDKLRIGPDD